ncbi:AI-2E family transporter [Lactobacillus amylolyticus]|uniref:AI-2E family transporter n=1 Tax=Lactobacillus amylolyticus TaxID=83683 RepID=UPI0009BB51EA|nr:AI-2E family transporter [Lactobacillus amylolyticus]ARD06186.1 AI-2E family transporter [Lactobacillus amylolyticus]
MENAWQRFKQNVPLRRFVVLLVIIALLYEMRAMMNTILLTFIFTYLVVHLIRLVQRHIPKIPSGVIVSITYILILLCLYFAVTIYLPMLVKQISKMFKSVLAFYESDSMTGIMRYVSRYVNRNELVTQAKTGMSVMMKTLTSVGTLTVSIFMSLILSFFYTIELKKMNEFSNLFVKSGIFKWFFEDVRYFGRKFTNTFGVVLEAQFFIALCNTALTMICLAFMKMPQIIALGLMVFILSLIPVAGVIISLIPLSIVGYSVGGIRYVIYIFIMIMIIHAVEAYVLNPKFMASKTELPIFYTFLVLLVAEHFWGTWGLIVGVPIFTFFLDVLGIKPTKKSKKKAVLK